MRHLTLIIELNFGPSRSVGATCKTLLITVMDVVSWGPLVGKPPNVPACNVPWHDSTGPSLIYI